MTLKFGIFMEEVSEDLLRLSELFPEFSKNFVNFRTLDEVSISKHLGVIINLKG